LLGKDLTKGLGAGGEPKIGQKAAEESRSELREIFKDTNLVFLITGLGGGTGTGAAPAIARIAKEQGALVIGAVTLPFKIEGARISKAEDGLYQLRQCCDTVIVIENQKLLEYGGNLPLQEAFKLGDQVMSEMVKGITETISQPSLVNLDYADVRTIMRSGGVSTIGIGISDSSDRAKEAVSRALKHPLLQVDYAGANGALIQIIGGPDLTLEEVNEIGESVSKYLSAESQTIWGARILDDYEGKVQVITVITGVKSPYILGPVKEAKPGEVQTEISENLGIEVFR
jgi:cell division protein FtsZ